MKHVVLYVLINFFCHANFILAKDFHSDFTEYRQGLSRLNRYSSIEGAGSHGSFGLHLGLAAFQYPSINLSVINEPGTTNQINKDQKDEDKAWQLRALIIKGTPWPVDFALSLSQFELANHSIAQLGGHIQWSFYEQLSLPALAARISYLRLHNMPQTSFDSLALDFVTSYGFLRYFEAFASLGLQENRTTLYLNNPHAYGLSNSEQDSFQSIDYSTNYSWGLAITILPPFVNFSIEQKFTPDVEEVLAAKLNMML